MSSNLLDEVIPMSEASQLLKRSPETLRAWLRAGRLTGRCLDGRVWVFSREELDRIAATLTKKVPE